jgi:hypothetical protein
MADRKFTNAKGSTKEFIEVSFHLKQNTFRP